MNYKVIGLFFLMVALNLNWAIGQDSHPLVGKWDLTVDMNGQQRPSWLEVKLSGYETLVGQFVSFSGSARPISEINMEENLFKFTIPRQWEEKGLDLSISGKITDGVLTGQVIQTNGNVYTFVGKKAGKIKHLDKPKEGKKIKLFNGKDLSGWHLDGEKEQWMVKNKILVNPEAGSNLISDQEFDNFRLIMEFRYPEGSNSGVYLRGRYEVQIADNAGLEPSNILFGGIYGFLTPNEMVAKEAGKWQSYDITLNGNRVSITANGKPIIVDQIIPGITGGAIDSKEGSPGPIMIQGDHGPVEFRKIEIIPLTE